MSPVKKAGIKELFEICTDIFDQSLLHTLSPTSMVWEIVGATELPHLHIDPNGEVQLDLDIPIKALPQYTRLTIESILQILKENRHLFQVDLDFFFRREGCMLCNRLSYREFLRNEVRSRHLHATYRNSVIHALRSRITYIKNLKSVEVCVAFSTHSFMVDVVTYYPWYRLDRVGSIFLSFCKLGWDIRIDTDLQEGSAMCEVVDLLLDCKPILPHSLMSVDVDGHTAIDLVYSHMTLQWLVKQVHVSLRSYIRSMLMINTLLFEILKAVPNPNPRIFSMIQKLQDIINRSKEDAIILTFGQELLYTCSILPPYGVTVFTAESVERGEWDDDLSCSSSIRTFYSDISFLLSEGVSAKCHSSILEYHLFVLVSWINLLINDWYVSLYF